jgi:spermidine synthase
MFGPKITEEVDSKYSGRLKVISAWGYKYIATGTLTQSGGLVNDVWKPVLKKIKNRNTKIKKVLILGLAGGTIAGIMSDIFHPEIITGVEIDPVMIDLGKKYLKLDKIPNLEIIIDDANSFILHLPLHLHFDCILVDMYIGDRLPDFVYDEKFLKKLGRLGKLVIFNHLFYDAIKRKQAGQLVERLKHIFPDVQLVRKLTNLLIICS